MTLDDAIAILLSYTKNPQLGDARVQAEQAARLVADEVGIIRQRYADQECQRYGDIIFYSLTPEQYTAAIKESQARHPHLWTGRYVPASTPPKDAPVYPAQE